MTGLAAAALLLGVSLSLQDGQEAAVGPLRAAAPAASEAIAREFAELHDLLRQTPSDPIDASSVLAARLAVFVHRFGSEPRAAPQWGAFEAAAQGHLARLGEPDHGAYGVMHAVQRITLMDIVGLTAEAQVQLDVLEVDGANGSQCFTSDNGVVVHQRRSEFCERRGDLAGALAWAGEACFDLEAARTCIHQHTEGHLLHARYGLLLCRTGYAAEGELVLRWVVQTYPASIGAELAQAELTRRGVSADGLATALIADTLRWGPYGQHAGALLVTDAARPGWVQILAARIPRGGKEWGWEAVSFDPDAFERLRPVALEVLESDPQYWAVGPALRVVQGLRGGADPHVAPLLERMSLATTERFAGTQRIDSVLRYLYGGGPVLPCEPRDCTGADFAGAWRAWLDARSAGW